MSLHYFELPKLPETVNADRADALYKPCQMCYNTYAVWYTETEEELQRIEASEVTVMEQAIKAYRNITATEEFRTLERMRSDARHNEASALGNARREGYREAEEKLQGVIAEKDTRIAQLEAQIAKYENK
jgi:vacuolar-type H+-ATPase subunit E/Vma4